MAKEKEEVAQGCGGCVGGCSNAGDNANGEGSSPEVPWGESVAKSAVAGMDAPKAKAEGACLSEELQIKEEDVDGFLEACERQGKNPLDVVKYIAERNGIDLSSVPRGDSLKLRIYELLKGVVRKVLFGFVSYCADNYGIGVLQSIIGSVGNPCGSCCDIEKSVPRSQDKESEFPVKVEERFVRIIPVRLGYAFPW